MSDDDPLPTRVPEATSDKGAGLMASQFNWIDEVQSQCGILLYLAWFFGLAAHYGAVETAAFTWFGHTRDGVVVSYDSYTTYTKGRGYHDEHCPVVEYRNAEQTHTVRSGACEDHPDLRPGDIVQVRIAPLPIPQARIIGDNVALITYLVCALIAGIAGGVLSFLRWRSSNGGDQKLESGPQRFYQPPSVRVKGNREEQYEQAHVRVPRTSSSSQQAIRNSAQNHRPHKVHITLTVRPGLSRSQALRVAQELRRHLAEPYCKLLAKLKSSSPVFAVELRSENFYAGLEGLLSVARSLDALAISYVLHRDGAETDFARLQQKEIELAHLSLSDMR